MSEELPYSIPKYSWWYNEKSKRLFVVVEKWHTGVGTTFKLDSIDLLQVGKDTAIKISAKDFKQMTDSKQLNLVPINMEEDYRLSFI